MIKANPRLRRQLPLTGPMLFWRLAEDNVSKVGLVVVTASCANPKCPCRKVVLTAYRMNDQILGAAATATGLKFSFSAAKPDAATALGDPCALLAALDLDTGRLAVHDEAPPNHRDEAALAWLREEMDGKVLDHIAVQVLRQKGIQPFARLDIHAFDQSRMVGFPEAHLTGRIDSYIIHSRRLDVLDVYCVDPTCDCTEMRFVGSENKRTLGSIIVDLTGKTPPRFEGKAVMNHLWQAISGRYPSLDVFRKREAKMKAVGRDLLASPAAPSHPGPTISRNHPCPCGSGKKYKRCCIGKHLPNA